LERVAMMVHDDKAGKICHKKSGGNLGKYICLTCFWSVEAATMLQRSGLSEVQSNDGCCRLLTVDVDTVDKALYFTVQSLLVFQQQSAALAA
jgi:hypothetical protein